MHHGCPLGPGWRMESLRNVCCSAAAVIWRLWLWGGACHVSKEGGERLPACRAPSRLVESYPFQEANLMKLMATSPAGGQRLPCQNWGEKVLQAENACFDVHGFDERRMRFFKNSKVSQRFLIDKASLRDEKKKMQKRP
jgi:hypothetical protein